MFRANRQNAYNSLRTNRLGPTHDFLWLVKSRQDLVIAGVRDLHFNLASDQNAFDAAAVGLFDVIFKPGGSENVLGHLNHNVVCCCTGIVAKP